MAAAFIVGGSAAVVVGALALAGGAAWLAGMVVGGFDEAIGGEAGRIVGDTLGTGGMATVDTINSAVGIIGAVCGALSFAGWLRGKISGGGTRGPVAKGGTPVSETPLLEPEVPVPARGGAEPYWSSRRGVHYIKSATHATENGKVWKNDPLIGRRPDLVDWGKRIWHESKNTSDQVGFIKQIRETAALAKREGFEYHVWVRQGYARSTLINAAARGELVLHYFPW